MATATAAAAETTTPNGTPKAAKPVPASKPAAALAPKPAAPASRLGAVKRGRIKAPRKIVIYGPEGVGKSTLAADAPDPIFIDADEGTSDLDIYRYPFVVNADGTVPPGGHIPRSYPDVLLAINDLTSGEHQFRTLVIDTGDKIEALMWRFMLERDSVVSATNKSGRKLNSIEDYGYGKGFQVALDEWRALLVRLDRLRLAKNMQVIILAHTTVKTFKNPIGDDYDRFQLRIQERSAGLLREWADVTGFACWEEGAKKDDGAARAKGFSTGTRLLKVVRAAAYDAKTRLALPEEIELDALHPWAPLAAAIEASDEIDPKVLQKQIAAETDRIGDAALTAKVNAAVAGAVAKSDVAALGRYLQELRKRQAATDNNDNSEKGSGQ